MFRGVKSMVKTVDRFLRLPPSTVRLKQPLNAIFNHASSLLPLRNSVTNHTIPLAREISNIARSRVDAKAGLSLPAKVALGRPLSAPFLPRAPIVPRSIAQVGLGTARNFSSSRPIFQNIVDNVPIATRAFWEADWEIRARAERAKTLKKMPTKRSISKKSSRRSSLVAPKPSVGANTSLEQSAEPEYFVPANKTTEKVTTYLTIPLAPPEPTRRMPLPAADYTDFLPISEICAIHSAHELHTIRVASLFRRLDAADIWSRNVDCEPYGGSVGVPEFLVLIFRGWTELEVRDVIGEAPGWCSLESVERAEPKAQPAQDITHRQLGYGTHDIDCPSLNYGLNSQGLPLVMPSLDLSASPQLIGEDYSSARPWQRAKTPSVICESESEVGEDPWAGDNWSEVNWTCPPSECGDMEQSQLSWADEVSTTDFHSAIVHWSEPSAGSNERVWSPI